MSPSLFMDCTGGGGEGGWGVGFGSVKRHISKTENKVMI